MEAFHSPALNLAAEGSNILGYHFVGPAENQQPIAVLLYVQQRSLLASVYCISCHPLVCAQTPTPLPSPLNRWGGEDACLLSAD